MVLPSTKRITKKRSMRSISASASSSSSEISITEGRGGVRKHRPSSDKNKTIATAIDLSRRQTSNILRRLRERSIADRDDCYLAAATCHQAAAAGIKSAIARIQQKITPISNIPYIHSSYAAASPNLLDSPKWMRILKTLMPNLDFTIQRSDRMIQQCENNPVMAAFGVLNSKHLAPLEWDIFLDPKLVLQYNGDDTTTSDVGVEESLVCRMMLAHGSAAQLLMEATGVAQQWNFEAIVANQEVNKIKSGMFVHTWLQLFASALQMGIATDDDDEYTNDSGDDEEEDEEETPMEEPRNLLMSPSTLNQSFRSTRSSSRKIVPAADKKNTNICFESSAVIDSNSTSFSRICGLMSSYLMSEDEEMVENRNRMQQIRHSIQIINRILGQPLALILDLKSRFVPSKVWSRLVRTLEGLGLSIHAIGSFDILELRQIAVQQEQTQKYLFFHSAGDFQKAVDVSKEIQVGDTIFFNAGSLIRGKKKRSSSNLICGQSCCMTTDDLGGSIRTSSGSLQNSLLYQEQIMDDAMEEEEDDEYYGGLEFYPFAYPNNKKHTNKKTLQYYQQQYKLKIGLYVQEVSIGPNELDGLVQFINKHRSIYNIGLAWGGLDECHFQDIQGTGYGTQRYVGTNWDS